MTLRFELHGAVGRGVEVEIQAFAAEETQERVTGVLTEPVELDLKPHRNWRIQATAPGLWAREETIYPQGVVETTRPETLVLHFWPTGELLGTFEVAEGEGLPDTVQAHFRSPPRDGRPGPIAQAHHGCTVDEGAFACELPAETLDLRLKAPGFASVVRWGVEVKAGNAVKLPPLHLVRGASVVGWVTTPGGEPALTRVQVVLEPMGLLATSLEEMESRRALSRQTVHPDRRGFFRFTGLGPGAYQIVAGLKGLAAARSEVLTVHADVESELIDPLHLRSFQPVDVWVEPAVDPWGRPWTVEVHELGTNPVPRLVAGSLVGEDGGWKNQTLGQGTYTLSVRSQEGSTWYRQEMDLGQEPLFLSVQVPVVPVLGSLRLGKKPFSAKLLFSGKGSVEMTSDEDGNFGGILPGEGEYRVRITSRSLIKTVSGVEVRRGPGQRRARVEIVLPANRIRGRVVDAEGSPVAPANLLAVTFPDDVLRSTRVHKDGTFELLALKEGTVRLHAEAPGDRASEERVMSVVEGLDPPEIELVVRPQTVLRGRIRTATGAALPGVEILAGAASAFLAPTRAVVSDHEGRFELRLPPNTTEIVANVYPRGFALRMLRLPLPPSGEIDIWVEQNGGDLLIDFDGRPSYSLYSEKTLVLLRHGGGSQALHGLGNWWRQNRVQERPLSPHQTVVPSLEPGEYALCNVASHRYASLLAQSLRVPVQALQGFDCSPFLIQSGQQTRLDFSLAQERHTDPAPVRNLGDDGESARREPRR